MEIFGFSIEKVVVLGVLAGILLGPERLASMVSEGTRMLQKLRQKTDGALDALRDELGPDIAEIDWQRLDPRRYDPRRIIADALLTPPDSSVPVAERVAALDPLGAAPAATGTPDERK